MKTVTNGVTMNVAFFGGSFDPPHNGHVAVVEWLLARDDIDSVLVVPCFAHPFGKKMSPFHSRIAMCRAAFARFGEKVMVSDVESGLGPVSFTVDTLSRLADLNPGWKMRLVFGSDIPSDTSRWKDFDRVCRLAPPICVNRGGMETNPEAPVFPRVSSTNVRRRAASGLEIGHMVPPPVAELVDRERLYRVAPGIASPRTVICGCGRVGTSLALSFNAAGIHATVIDREGVLAARTNLPPDTPRATSINNAVPPGPAVWFVCTGDTSAADVITQIDAIGDPCLDFCAVTSATASIDRGWTIPVCRAHPLKAFPPAAAASVVPARTVFALQSAPPAVAALLDAIGASCFELAGDRVAAYHAAAVLASNLPGALAWEAAEMFRACGVPDPERASIDLMQSMIDNVAAGGFRAISGPAARGDAWTVAADQAAAERFDGRAGIVHRILADIISTDIFGYPATAPDKTENRN